MTRRSFILAVVAILAVGATLRLAWLRSDPATFASVGVVWHDEGAWTHNARNRALWGEWRTDAWNPMFLAPVFTALEYGAFRIAGVGTWQARLVPAVSGLAAVLLLIVGLHALAGRRTALIGGLLLATNYVFVMWNRAALMESTMTAAIVAAWAAYALAERRPWWGVLAGVCVVIAWFTKAAAAFFLAAIVIDAVFTLALGHGRLRSWLRVPEIPTPAARKAAMLTLAGIAAATAIAAVVFVVPYWTEYRFYNWQMSVTRKPSYTLQDFKDRATWLPLVQGLFTRMWIVVAASAVAMAGIASRWRTASPAERLLVLWVLVGFAELIVHDAGNERRYVMFVPALIALASLLAGSTRSLFDQGLVAASWMTRLLAAPLLLFLGYIVMGSLLRLALLDDVLAGNLKPAVRLSAGAAALACAVLLWRWRPMTALLGRAVVPIRAVGVVLVIAVGWNLYEYAGWARQRAERNYLASVELGRTLPPGTLVQGKLANGLALENRIRPLFVGNGFGNYEDRLQRDDARYILTYDLPRVGYESSDGSGLIQGILDRYPRQRVIATFDVDETPFVDRAVLIDKFPAPQLGSHARD